jgi:hypothetical protein
VVVSRDVVPASETVAGVVELATQAEVDTGTDTTRVVTPATLASYTGLGGTPEGTAVLSTGETVGKLLRADGDNTCSWVAAPSGTPEGTAILSTGETGGTKFLREDGDGTCSWQAAAGGTTDLVTDLTPQLGAQLDVNGFAIGDGTLELLSFTETGSAVNHINVTNAATGNAPELAAAGGDTNADLALSSKGTGEIIQTAQGTVQRNGNFATAGDAQSMTYVLRGSTTNTVVFTEIFLDGASTKMVIPDDTTWAFDALIVARLGTTQASAAYNVFGCIDNESGTVALVGSVQKGTPIEDNPNASDWDVQFTADDTNNSLKLEVKGGTGLGGTIRWVATVRISQVSNSTAGSY